MIKKAKKDLMPARISRAKKRLDIVSHSYIRHRDSIGDDIGGHCITCGKLCYGPDFQAGHFEPSSTCGIWLRHHPHNMAGQGGYCCNINKHGQQKMGIAYTMAMIDRYGKEYVEYLRSQKNRGCKSVAMIDYLETMIELYSQGNETKIIQYLESL